MKGEEDKVCLLKKSFYGLEQSNRQWFDSYLADIGFQKLEYDSCVYLMMKDGRAAVSKFKHCLKLVGVVAC